MYQVPSSGSAEVEKNRAEKVVYHSSVGNGPQNKRSKDIWMYPIMRGLTSTQMNGRVVTALKVGTGGTNELAHEFEHKKGNSNT